MKRLLSPIVIAMLSMLPYALTAQSCEEMIAQAKSAEKRGNYFDAYKKYDAALRRCPENQRSEIESIKNKLVDQLNDQKARAQSAEKLAQQQTAIAHKQRERATRLANSSQNIALTLSYLKSDPTLAFRISELNYNIYKEDPAAATNFFQTLADTAILFYQYRSDWEDKISSMDISPDGNLAAAGLNNGELIIWNPNDENPVYRKITAHTGGYSNEIRTVCFSTDGKILFTGGANWKKLIWDVADMNKEPIILGGSNAAVMSSAFSPDGKYLAVGISGGNAALPKVQIWETGNLKGDPLFARDYQNKPNTIAFKPQTASLAIGGDDNLIRLWEFNCKDSISATYIGNVGDVTALCFSPDAKLLLSGGSEGPISLWKENNPKPEIYNGHLEAVRKVQFLPFGEMFASVGLDKTLRIWKTGSTGASIRNYLGHQGSVNNFIVTADRKIWTCSSDRTLRRWEYSARKGAETILNNHSGKIISINTDPELSTLWSVSSDGKLCRTSIDENRIVVKTDSVMAHQCSVTSMAYWSRNGHVATAALDSVIQIWGYQNNKIEKIYTITGLPAPAFSLQTSPDGNWLVSGVGDSAIYVWDMRQPVPKLVFTSDRMEGWTLDFEFSPDGNTLFSAGTYQSIYCWDSHNMAKLTQKYKLTRHGSRVNSISYNEKQQKLASASIDGTLLLWNVAQPEGTPDIFPITTGNNDEYPQLVKWLPGDAGLAASFGLPMLYYFQSNGNKSPFWTNYESMRTDYFITALAAPGKTKYCIVGRKNGRIEIRPTVDLYIEKAVFHPQLSEILKSGFSMDYDSLLLQNLDKSKIYPAVAKVLFDKGLYSQSHSLWEKAVREESTPENNIGLFRAEKSLGIDRSADYLKADSNTVKAMILYFRDNGDWVNAERFLRFYRSNISDNFRLQSQHYAACVRTRQTFDYSVWAKLDNPNTINRLIAEIQKEIPRESSDLHQKKIVYNDYLRLMDIGIALDSNKFDKWYPAIYSYNIAGYNFRTGDYRKSLECLDRASKYFPSARQIVAFRARLLLLNERYEEAEEEYLKRLDKTYDPGAGIATYRDYYKWDLNDLIQLGVLNEKQRNVANRLLAKM